MKQTFLHSALVAVMMLAGTMTASAQGFIDLQARIAKQKYEQNADVARARGTAMDGGERMKLFVTTAKDADAHSVAAAAREIGATVRVVKGNLIALEIPYDKLEDLANVEGVAIVNMPPRMFQKSDVNRAVTQAAEVNDGTAPMLPQAYTGKDVIVGVIDGGFDISHPMFKDKDGNLRIKGFYEPGNPSFGGEPVEVLFDNGTTSIISGSAYSKPEDLLDTLKVKDVDGSHGSFCASIAAGSVMTDVQGTSGKAIGGIAPESDIMLCNIHNSESGNAAWDLVECLYYMGNEAYQTDRPLVMSLSQNNHFGWHDGTSDIARYLGLLCNEGHLNVILCTSNEGGYNCYINEQVKANKTLQLTAYTDKSDNYVWGGMKTAKEVKMEIGIVNMTANKEYYRVPMSFKSTGQSMEEVGLYFNFDNDSQQLSRDAKAVKRAFKKYLQGGELMIACYQAQALDQQNQPYVYTQVLVETFGTKWINGDSRNGEPQQWGFNLYLTPKEDTELHAWGDQGYELQAVRSDGAVVEGTSDCSMGDWNTSGYPVSIGAWCANNTVHYENTEPTESIFTLDDVAFFSSYGTDLAGNRHPDACAPGTNIVAAYNSFDPARDDSRLYTRKAYDNQFVGQQENRDYYYVVGSGTSASTPVVAGVVALWMQAANDVGKTLTCADIKDIIAHSCDTDEYTEASPERFGYGKVNAYKGLLYVLDIATSIPSLSKEQPRGVTFRVSGDMVWADGADDGTPVVVYDLKGVKVRETAVHDGAISTTGLPAGVYAVQLGKLGSTLIRK